jgi:hypothetical protein
VFCYVVSWGGAPVGMNEGKVVSNGVLISANIKCFVNVSKDLRSTWFLVDCSYICTKNVCLVSRNLHFECLIARIIP